MHRSKTLSRLMIAAAAITMAWAVTAQGSPRAVPTEPIKDFNVVAKGEVISHDFEIKNEGDAPLEISDVRPACGCTVARFDKTIAPGKTGKVSIRLKTETFSGPISKSVAVFTNDPQNPKLQLVAKAQVKPYIGIAPGYARYNYVQGEAIGAIKQTLWSEDGHDLKILDVKVPYDYLKVEYRQASEGERNVKATGSQWRLEISLMEDAPVGALREHVTVVTDHPKQKVVNIPISGFVRPRQHMTPESVDFGPLEGSKLPLQRTLHFSNFITKQIELTKIETGYPGLQAEVIANERQPGYRFKLLLTVGPDMPKGAFDSNIKIYTTDEQNPIIELPVKGTIL